MMMITSEDWEISQHLKNRLARKGQPTFSQHATWIGDFHDAVHMAVLVRTPKQRRDPSYNGPGRLMNAYTLAKRI